MVIGFYLTCHLIESLPVIERPWCPWWIIVVHTKCMESLVFYNNSNNNSNPCDPCNPFEEVGGWMCWWMCMCLCGVGVRVRVDGSNLMPFGVKNTHVHCHVNLSWLWWLMVDTAVGYSQTEFKLDWLADSRALYIQQLFMNITNYDTCNWIHI